MGTYFKNVFNSQNTSILFSFSQWFLCLLTKEHEVDKREKDREKIHQNVLELGD